MLLRYKNEDNIFHKTVVTIFLGSSLRKPQPDLRKAIYSLSSHYLHAHESCIFVGFLFEG